LRGGRKSWYNTRMTIKKQTAGGGATIADRFKLDVPDPNAKKGVGKTSATVALVVGVAALAAVGTLTFILYQHWDFLCNQVA